MFRTTKIVFVLPIMLMLGNAHSEENKIYQCKNAKGEILYLQSYDPVQCVGGGAQLNGQGIAIRTIERAKTAEELAQDKIATQKENERKEAEERQRKSDFILLASYSSIEDIELSRVQDVAAVKLDIQSIDYQKNTQQKTLAALLGEAAEFERAKKPIPEALAEKLALVRQQLAKQVSLVEQKRRTILAINAAYALKQKRYLELKQAQKGP
jgi:hypothetical protein